MTGAVAPETTATAPQEREWRWYVVALVMMVLVTVASGWPAALALVAGAVRVLLPVEQFAVLVLVAIAACAVVGWWAGGRLSLALLWVAAAGVVLWKIALPEGYGAFVRGWALAMGAAFGLVCLGTRARPFLGRALAAVALAGVVTTAGLASRSDYGATLDGIARTLGSEYGRRVNESLEGWRNRTNSEAWRAVAGRLPDAADRGDRMAGVLSALGMPKSRGGTGAMLAIAPALLGLESLLALSLGWATYHRLSRVRIGPPLGALRDLRFNDQLVWGLVIGATLLLLPSLADRRTAGANVVCFFGTLYALRGAGVLTWWVPERVAAFAPLALVILVPLLGPVFVFGALLAITFGLGLGDTWRDFRAGADSRRPSSLL